MPGFGTRRFPQASLQEILIDNQTISRSSTAVSQPAQAQYRQIDIWIMLGKIGFEWFSAHAEGFLKAVGRKPSGEGSSVVFHARTLRKLLDILTHRAACAAPLSFAD